MGRFAQAAKDAATLTDQQLVGEIAKLGTLSAVKVQELLPRKQDKEAFLKHLRAGRICSIDPGCSTPAGSRAPMGAPPGPGALLHAESSTVRPRRARPDHDAAKQVITIA